MPQQTDKKGELSGAKEKSRLINVMEGTLVMPGGTLEDVPLAADNVITHGNNLATALMEDENVRQASEKRSRAYLKAKDEHDSSTPEWMWNMLWFILGVITVITIEVTILPNTETISKWVSTIIEGGF